MWRGGISLIWMKRIYWRGISQLSEILILCMYLYFFSTHLFNSLSHSLSLSHTLSWFPFPYLLLLVSPHQVLALSLSLTPDWPRAGFTRPADLLISIAVTCAAVSLHAYVRHIRTRSHAQSVCTVPRRLQLTEPRKCRRRRSDRLLPSFRPLSVEHPLSDRLSMLWCSTLELFVRRPLIHAHVVRDSR